jgi:hypothetical protein
MGIWGTLRFSLSFSLSGLKLSSKGGNSFQITYLDGQKYFLSFKQ